MRENIVKWLIILMLLLLWGCNGENKMVNSESIEKKLNSILSETWQQLAVKKIYWGHQSVGSNILGGMQELLSAHSRIPLKIIKVKEPYELVSGCLNHSSIGNNSDPSSKIKDFVRMVDSGIGNQADFAFFKFCYIDFNARSDVKKVFEEYKTAMLSLKEKYSETQFMHTTIPLLKVQTGPKAWVKKIIGRTLDGTKDNGKRCAFNDMLRAEYDGKDPIFDIAKAESTRSDGSRETFVLDGKTYFALVPAYTSDGGHLNKLGSKYLASELLALLVDVSGQAD